MSRSGGSSGGGGSAPVSPQPPEQQHAYPRVRDALTEVNGGAGRVRRPVEHSAGRSPLLSTGAPTPTPRFATEVYAARLDDQPPTPPPRPPRPPVPAPFPTDTPTPRVQLGGAAAESERERHPSQFIARPKPRSPEPSSPTPRAGSLLTMDKWDCPSCTFENPGGPSNIVCQICGAERPPSSEKWQCSKCTFLNSSAIDECEMCGHKPGCSMCSHCGASGPAGARFCSSCGKHHEQAEDDDSPLNSDVAHARSQSGEQDGNDESGDEDEGKSDDISDDEMLDVSSMSEEDRQSLMRRLLRSVQDSDTGAAVEGDAGDEEPTIPRSTARKMVDLAGLWTEQLRTRKHPACEEDQSRYAVSPVVAELRTGSSAVDPEFSVQLYVCARLHPSPAAESVLTSVLRSASNVKNPRNVSRAIQDCQSLYEPLLDADGHKKLFSTFQWAASLLDCASLHLWQTLNSRGKHFARAFSYLVRAQDALEAAGEDDFDDSHLLLWARVQSYLALTRVCQACEALDEDDIEGHAKYLSMAVTHVRAALVRSEAIANAERQLDAMPSTQSVLLRLGMQLVQLCSRSLWLHVWYPGMQHPLRALAVAVLEQSLDAASHQYVVQQLKDKTVEWFLATQERLGMAPMEQRSLLVVSLVQAHCAYVHCSSTSANDAEVCIMQTREYVEFLHLHQLERELLNDLDLLRATRINTLARRKTCANEYRDLAHDYFAQRRQQRQRPNRPHEEAGSAAAADAGMRAEGARVLLKSMFVKAYTDPVMAQVWIAQQDGSSVLGDLSDQRFQGAWDLLRGFVASRCQDRANACQYLDRALERLCELPFPLDYARALTAKGLALTANLPCAGLRTELEEERTCLHKALEVYSAAMGGYRDVTWARINIFFASTYERQLWGNRVATLKHALELYVNTLRSFSADTQPVLFARLLLHIGRVCAKLGKEMHKTHAGGDVGAHAVPRETWQVSESRMGIEIVDGLMESLSMLCYGDFIEASRLCLVEAEKTLTPEVDADAPADLLLARVQGAMVVEQLDVALAALNALWSSFDQSAQPDDTRIQYHYWKGVLLHREFVKARGAERERKKRESETSFKHALEMLHPQEVGLMHIATLHALGQLYSDNGEHSYAEERYKEAISTIERVREQFVMMAVSRQALTECFIGLYQDVVHANCELGSLKPAFNHMERSRARNLLDGVADAFDTPADLASEDAAELKRLNEQISDLDRDMNQYRRDGVSIPIELHHEYRAALQRLTVFREKQQLVGVLLDMRGADPMKSFEEFSSAVLIPSLCVVEFFFARDCLLVFLMHSGGKIELCEEKCPTRVIETLVAKYTQTYRADIFRADKRAKDVASRHDKSGAGSPVPPATVGADEESSGDDSDDELAESDEESSDESSSGEEPFDYAQWGTRSMTTKRAAAEYRKRPNKAGDARMQRTASKRELVRAVSKSRPDGKHDMDACLRDIAEALSIDSIIAQIPAHVTELVIIPHLFLHLVPLHALPLNDARNMTSCVLDRFPDGVRYSPSCQLLRLACERESERSEQQLGRSMSHSDMLESLRGCHELQGDLVSLACDPTRRLVFERLEASVVRAFWSEAQHGDATVHALDDAMATKERFGNVVANVPARCLQFSGHGIFSSDSSRETGLVFYKPESQAGQGRGLGLASAGDILTVHEMYRLPLANCELATLSACETGVVDVNTHSDEYMGVCGALITAGAQSVVSTLWRVNDFSSCIMFIRFYEVLLLGEAGMTPTRALRETQLWMRHVTTNELVAWLGEVRSRIDASEAEVDKRSFDLLVWLANANGSRDRSAPRFDHVMHWASAVIVGGANSSRNQLDDHEAAPAAEVQGGALSFPEDSASLYGWLRSLGLAEYAPVLQKNHVYGSVLLELTEANLDTLGIVSFGHRRRLLAAIEEARAAQGLAVYASPDMSGRDVRDMFAWTSEDVQLWLECMFCPPGLKASLEGVDGVGLVAGFARLKECWPLEAEFLEPRLRAAWEQAMQLDRDMQVAWWCSPWTSDAWELLVAGIVQGQPKWATEALVAGFENVVDGGKLLTEACFQLRRVRRVLARIGVQWGDIAVRVRESALEKSERVERALAIITGASLPPEEECDFSEFEHVEEAGALVAYVLSGRVNSVWAERLADVLRDTHGFGSVLVAHEHLDAVLSNAKFVAGPTDRLLVVVAANGYDASLDESRAHATEVKVVTGESELEALVRSSGAGLMTGVHARMVPPPLCEESESVVFHVTHSGQPRVVRTLGVVARRLEAKGVRVFVAGDREATQQSVWGCEAGVLVVDTTFGPAQLREVRALVKRGVPLVVFLVEPRRGLGSALASLVSEEHVLRVKCVPREFVLELGKAAESLGW